MNENDKVHYRVQYHIIFLASPATHDPQVVVLITEITKGKSFHVQLITVTKKQTLS